MKEHLKLLYQNLPNYGYISTKIPNDLYKLLIIECIKAKRRNKKMVTNFTGVGIAKHFYLEDENTILQLNNFLMNLKDEYDKLYPGLHNIKVFTDPLPYVCEKHWVNFQHKGQFLPNHTHNGIYSYTIWMRIPYESEEELKNGGNHASCFSFSYSDILGKLNDWIIKLGKKDEGTIIFFPSKLTHNVYPFYNSNKARISISGNILFDTKK
jgi:hypothetical protein